MANDKILNIYGQEYWHTDAKIVGNRLALEDLMRMIHTAIRQSTPVTYGKATMGKVVPLYASDGEGYELTIICAQSDSWEDPIWKDNPPEYREVRKWEC